MEYLRSVWAALVPVTEVRSDEHADLEACGGACAQSIVIVTDAADVRVQVRPLLRASDVEQLTCV